MGNLIFNRPHDTICFMIVGFFFSFPQVYPKILLHFSNYISLIIKNSLVQPVLAVRQFLERHIIKGIVIKGFYTSSQETCSLYL